MKLEAKSKKFIKCIWTWIASQLTARHTSYIQTIQCATFCSNAWAVDQRWNAAEIGECTKKLKTRPFHDKCVFFNFFMWVNRWIFRRNISAVLCFSGVGGLAAWTPSYSSVVDLSCGFSASPSVKTRPTLNRRLGAARDLWDSSTSLAHQNVIGALILLDPTKYHVYFTQPQTAVDSWLRLS